MTKYIPSKEQRDYFNKVGFDFTDFQKASLIWNSSCVREEQLSSLEELLYRTDDNELKKQIAERLEYEKRAMEVFKENSEKNRFYAVGYCTEQCTEIIEGYFFQFDDAFEFSCELIEKELCNDKNVDSVWIEKNEISIGKQSSDSDRYNIDKYATNSCYGKITINMKGEIKELYTNECREEFEIQNGRFEDSFYTFPLSPEFQQGTVVQLVNEKNIYVVYSTYREWGEYYNAITVYEPTEDGCWSHEHVNPLYLTTDVDWSDTDSEYRETVNRMSDFIGGDSSAEEDVLKLSRKYADRNLRNKVYSAKKLSDIMF